MRSPLDIAKRSSKKELADPSCPNDITRHDAVRKPLCIRLCTRIRFRATQILTLIRTITFTLPALVPHHHSHSPPPARPSPSFTSPQPFPQAYSSLHPLTLTYPILTFHPLHLTCVSFKQLGQLQAAVGRMQDFERALAASLRFAPM